MGRGKYFEYEDSWSLLFPNTVQLLQELGEGCEVLASDICLKGAQSVLLPFWLVSSREAHTSTVSTAGTRWDPLFWVEDQLLPENMSGKSPGLGVEGSWVLIPGLPLHHWINAFTSQVSFPVCKNGVMLFQTEKEHLDGTVYFPHTVFCLIGTFALN